MNETQNSISSHKDQLVKNKCLKSFLLTCLHLYVNLEDDQKHPRRGASSNPTSQLEGASLNGSFTGDESVGFSSNKVKLSFNHPCKELIWLMPTLTTALLFFLEKFFSRLLAPKLSTTQMLEGKKLVRLQYILKVKNY